MGYKSRPGGWTVDVEFCPVCKVRLNKGVCERCGKTKEDYKGGNNGQMD